MTHNAAVQILDKAIAEINAMRNIGIYNDSDIRVKGKSIKDIAYHAMSNAGADASMLNSLRRVSFESQYTGDLAYQAFGRHETNRGLETTYINGLTAVVNLLEKERETHLQAIQTQEQNKSLAEQKRNNKIQIWTLIFAILTFIVSVLTFIK